MQATLRYYPDHRYAQARARCPNCEHASVYYVDDGAIPERDVCYYCGVAFWVNR